MIVRIKKLESRIKNLVSTVLLVFLCSVVIQGVDLLNSSGLILKTHAQESTASATGVLAEATDSGVLSKLDDLKKEIASKAADLKAEVDRRIANKAVVGKPSVITTDTITLDTISGNKTIKVDEYTLYQNTSSRKTKKAFEFKNILTDDTIVALGDTDERGSLKAKKIIRVDKVKSSAKKYITGNIVSVEGNSLNLVTKTGSSSAVPFNSKTIIKMGSSEVTAKDLIQGKTVITVLPTSEASAAAFIYIQPVSGMVKSK